MRYRVFSDKIWGRHVREMCENCYEMFVPEYTVTPNTLKNIASIEYGRAIIDTTAILPNWQRRLEKEAEIKTIYSLFSLVKNKTNISEIKKFADGLNKYAKPELTSLKNALEITNQIALNKDFEEDDLKNLHNELAKNTVTESKPKAYRSRKVLGKVDPEEILAYVVELFDWFNSLDAKQTHPVIISGVILSRLYALECFDNFNLFISYLSGLSALKTLGYSFKNYICISDYFKSTKLEFEQNINSISQNDEDFTGWIEYFSDAVAYDVINIKERVLLLARDTKIAKAAGRNKLTQRQEKIVEYLQDYGILQNRDFPIIFHGVSEDSVLRDLKYLINEDIIIKTGSTKSSRYELK